MEKEWVDVVDNIVKIGLPSIVTGVITVLGMKHSAKATRDKFMLEHKVKVLEKIADDMNTTFNAWSMLCSKYGAITKKMDNDSENIEFSKAQIAAIRERDKDLVHSWDKQQSASGRLRLLNAQKVVDCLSDYIEIVNNFRDLLLFDKRYPNYNEFSEIRAKASDTRKAFLKELASFYESIAS